MNRQQKNKRVLIILCIVVIAMFGFGFALVPLYNVFCDITGINGKITQSAKSSSSTIDHSRIITVEFLATNNEELPWSFYPLTETIKVHPGEVTRISYFAKNNTNHKMTIQAIPSVSPGLAAKYIKKTECFCFTQQTLNGGSSMAMPVIFHIESNIPKDINTISLSYTLFDTKAAKNIKQAKTGKIPHEAH